MEKWASEETRDILIRFYSFVEDLDGVEDLHFIIRDRVDDEVVFSFRILAQQKIKEVIRSKIAYKLQRMLPSAKVAVDPDAKSPLAKYVAWSPKERTARHGSERFTLFCGFLNQLSRLAVDMAKKDYFGSGERVEVAHVMSWILGCTEYGLLSTKEMQVGYYDRIMDKTHAYLRQSL